MEMIKLLDHMHRLKLRDIQVEGDCALCYRTLISSSPIYCCFNCNYYVHKSCSDLPPYLKINYHPHLLTLKRFDSFDCDACLVNGTGLAYHCKECRLYLDVRCAFKKPTIDQGQEQLQHFSHLHPLAFLPDPVDESFCRLCGLGCDGPAYGCLDCKCFLHQACARLEIPQEINHYFHTCPLTLTHKNYGKIRCSACGIDKEKAIYYQCNQCKFGEGEHPFQIDVQCALLSNTHSDNPGVIRHYGHGHPLLLQSLADDGLRKKCCVCGVQCNGLDYACVANDTIGCGFFLHRRCAVELPRGFHIHSHPNHPLTLRQVITPLRNNCNGCLRALRGLDYSCERCNYKLHLRCFPMPNIVYEDHDHPLLLILNEEGNEIDASRQIRCDHCGGECAQSIFRCMECDYELDYNLHLGCGPLPLTLNCRAHRPHPLTIAAPGKDVESDETQDSYCDACEEVRDTRFPTYNCEECHYRAEIGCVMSEVIAILKGEQGDMDLRSLIANKSGAVVSNEETQTLRRLMDSLIEREKEELNAIFDARERIVPRKVVPFENGKDMDILLAEVDFDYLFSPMGHEQFMINLTRGIPEHCIQFWVLDEVVVSVERYNHLITGSLAPILQKLCDKYGERGIFSCEDVKPLNPKLLLFFIIVYCGIVYSMINTKFDDVTDNILQNWWSCHDALSIAGFNVAIFSHKLLETTSGYIGSQIAEIMNKLRLHMHQVSEDMVNAKKQLDSLSERLEGIKLDPYCGKTNFGKKRLEKMVSMEGQDNVGLQV